MVSGLLRSRCEPQLSYSPFSCPAAGHDEGESGLREVVCGLPWSWGRGRRRGGGAHAPRPRNFHRRALQDPHDGECQLPTDADLLRAIDDAFRKRDARVERRLSDGERRDAVAYIKTFRRSSRTRASTSCR